MQSHGTDLVHDSSLTRQRALLQLPRLRLGHYPTPVEELSRLRAALGGGPQILIKRDDAISFACGGNKVRKLELVAAQARAEGADTLITAGGVQSNHARVTAAVAARLGMRCVLVLNGARPSGGLTGNTRLMERFGAELDFVPDRAARAPRMREVADTIAARGGRPFIIPLGASTPLGTLGFFLAVHELLSQIPPPQAIILASSSGGTQAGIAGGCALFGSPTRVIGVSADDASEEITRVSGQLASQAIALLGRGERPLALTPLEVDDTFVGGGYGQITAASHEAAQLAARTEGLVVDPVYTAKAFACLVAAIRQRRFAPDETVLFWHTGGLPGFFA